MKFFWRAGHLLEHAVDAKAHPEFFLERFEVDVHLPVRVVLEAGGEDALARFLVVRTEGVDEEDRPVDGEPQALVEERMMSICQRERWLAMIARSDDQVVLAPLGEASGIDAQVELICDTLLHAFSAGQPAAISGFNLPSATLEQALTDTLGKDHPIVASALTRVGLSPDQVAVLSAAARLDESAMAVVTVIDHGIKPHVHPDVISVIDSELGRITISYTTGPDGTRWTSVWPTSPDALRQDLGKLLDAAKTPA